MNNADKILSPNRAYTERNNNKISIKYVIYKIVISAKGKKSRTRHTKVLGDM